MGNVQVTLFSVTVNLPGCPRRSSCDSEQTHSVRANGPSSEAGSGVSDWSVVAASRVTRTIPPRLKVLRVSLKILIRRKLARTWWRLSEEVKAKKRLGITDKKLNLTFGRLGLWLHETRLYQHVSAKRRVSSLP